MPLIVVIKVYFKNCFFLFIDSAFYYDAKRKQKKDKLGGQFTNSKIYGFEELILPV